MTKSAVVLHPTEGELRAIITKAHEEHPRLGEYKREEWCCLGCITTDIGIELGKDAVEAWEAAHEAEWLLGG